MAFQFDRTDLCTCIWKWYLRIALDPSLSLSKLIVRLCVPPPYGLEKYLAVRPTLFTVRRIVHTHHTAFGHTVHPIWRQRTALSVPCPFTVRTCTVPPLSTVRISPSVSHNCSSHTLRISELIFVAHLACLYLGILQVDTLALSQMNLRVLKA